MIPPRSLALLAVAALVPPARAQQAIAPPLSFVENLGQWPAAVAFLARSRGANYWLERDGMTCSLVAAGAGECRGAAVKLRFVGAAGGEPRGERPRPGAHHFFVGDPDRWRHEARGFAAVRHERVYPGIDLLYRDHDGRVEYDLLVAPGADLDEVVVAVEGADALVLDGGDLLIETAAGTLRQPAPRTWQEDGHGSREVLPCRFRLRGDGRYGFSADGRDPRQALVVDPGLIWSSYLGGSSYEFSLDVVEHPGGEVTVVGETAASDFPTTAGAFDPSYNGSGAPTADVFVTRFDATGTSLVWSTFLGGSGGDKPYDVATDSSRTVWIVGNSASKNFPTTAGALQTTMRGASDAFVTRLSHDGSTLLFSTYLGGSDGDVGRGLALAGGGACLVTGVTSSSDFPTTAGAFDSTLDGTSDVFVALVQNGASLVWSTLLGGSSGDVGHAVANDLAGHATVTGVTSSADFPTTPGAFDTTPSGPSDAFVARVAAGGKALVYSTMLGGSNGDVAEDVAVDADGSAVVVGVSASGDFPTTPGALASAGGGSSDAFVTRVASDGGSLAFSLLIGGSKGDVNKGVAIQPSGTIAVGGQTSSGDFPTTPHAFQRMALGSADGYVLRIDRRGTGLLYSSLAGGSGSDGGEGLDAITDGAATLAGVTGSRDFPTSANAFDRGLTGSGDGFVTRLDLDCGAVRYGTDTPSCNGPIRIDVSRCPVAGDPAFAVICEGAPPGAAGAFLLGFGQDLTGLPAFGVRLHVALFPPPIIVSLASDAKGFAAQAIPLSGVAPGARAFAQFLWLNTAACGGAGTVSASDGLDFTVAQ